MKQQIKVLGAVSLIALSTLNLTACTSEDVALGAGVIIGAVVADGLGSGSNNNQRNDGGYHRGGGNHNSGGYQRPPEPPPHRMPAPPPGRGDRPGNRYGMTANSMQVVSQFNENSDADLQDSSSMTLTAVSSEVVATAQHFQISETAAEKIWTALVAAKQNDFTQIESMGLGHQDLVLMGQGENPSAAALKEVSDQLGLELNETHQVFQQMKADLSAVTAL